MNPLRAAIIGCGNIGSSYSSLVRSPGVYSHAHALSADPGTELVAASDPDAEHLRACGASWSVTELFADHLKMLERVQPEVVSICSPTDTHLLIGLDAIRFPSVQGVICEKPLALDSASARLLHEAAKQRGIPLLVNYSRRFDWGYRELHSRIREGAIGKVQTVTGLYAKGLFHNGTHWLDLARFLLGEPTTVHGFRSDFAFGEDETFAFRLGFASGQAASAEATDHAAHTVFEMDVVGTEGRVRLSNGGRSISYYDVTDSDFIIGARSVNTTPTSVADALAGALPAAVANLIDCVTGDGQPLCGGADGVAALVMAEAVRASALSDRRVALG